MKTFLSVRRIVWFGVLLLSSAMPVSAEMVVVVNAQTRVERLSREDVINIFMGRYRKFPDGSMARPFDIGTDSPERRIFYRKLLDKSQEEVNAYWARLVFSGRTAPPEEAESRDELLGEIARNPRAIGYVEKKNLPRDVKVVFSLPE